jgi:hypothetical protein
VEKAKYEAVLNCLTVDPWYTGLLGRSITHTTKAVKKKKTTVVSQSSVVSGSKNIHWIGGFESLSASTSKDTPDCAYGIVKSATLARSAVMVTSPAAPWYTCSSRKGKTQLTNRTEAKYEKREYNFFVTIYI